MPVPILPTIIQGPAIIQHNSVSIWTRGPITVTYKRDSFMIESDMQGKIDERMKSDIVHLAFQPDGQFFTGAFAKLYPYGNADIGKSIFGGADKSVVIWTKDGRKITYTRGAISKMPPLRLKPTDTLFGDMEIACLGKSATQRTAVDYWKVITALAFADATFDETKIITDIYKAAFGASPYDSMGAMEGYEVDYAVETKEIPAADVGIADIVISAITAKARFRPSNLTEVQIDTLLNHSGTTPVYPGESFSKAGTTLIITGQGATAPAPITITIAKAGPKDISWKYGTGEHLHQMLEFSSKWTFTAGTANALFTIA